MGSSAYLERLNDPTPWSKRIMPILGNFGRAGGTITACSEKEETDFLLVMSFSKLCSQPEGLVADVAALPRIKSVHFLETDLERTGIRTNERELRASDSTFACFMLAQSDHEETLEAAGSAISREGSLDDAPASSAIYRQVFALQA